VPAFESLAALFAGAVGSGTSGLDALVLLMLGGLLALGMPRISVRGRRRFWHPWANNGLLLLLVGLAIGPTQLGWISVPASEALRPMLGLLLTAAGVLVGTQLRFSYLRRAGAGFLVRHTAAGSVQFAAAAIPTALMAVSTMPVPLALGCAALVGACAVATAQRPPLSTEEHTSPKEIVARHVMSAGWWNILALVGGSLALSVAFQPPASDALWSPQFLLLGTPVVLGVVCGWLALRATNRDDLYLFLLAMLALSGGLALAVRAVPLFFGILVGVVLVNVAARKSSALEAVLEALEQPLAMGIGLLAGLCLGEQQVAAWMWLLLPVVILARWGVRHRLSPTHVELGLPNERRFAPAGSSGVLLVACAVLAPDPAPALVAPLVTALGLLTLVSDVVERRPLAVRQRAEGGA
jgi:hypothetical protein